MQVPLLDLKEQYASIRDEIEGPLLDLLATQQLVLGQPVAELENAIAEYSGTSCAVGVSSGSDAILLALMALEIGPGDEVITTPFTFFATAGCVARTGARPVFVDIEPDTCNLDPSKLQEAISPRTKAILPVHLYGQCADMDPILAIAENGDIPVIEDAAQAIGAEYKGRRAGSLGLAGCLSFYPTKNLGAFGDAGMIVTSDETYAEKLRIRRVHGGEPKYYHHVIGGNFRLDAIQALALSIKLKHLDDWTARRQQLARRYAELLEQSELTSTGAVQVPLIRQTRHIFNQFVVRVRQRDALKQHLHDSQIGCEVYYPVPLHLQKCFSYLGYKEGDFPESEKAAREVLALPIFPELTAEQQRAVVSAIESFYRSHSS